MEELDGIKMKRIMLDTNNTNPLMENSRVRTFPALSLKYITVIVRFIVLWVEEILYEVIARLF